MANLRIPFQDLQVNGILNQAENAKGLVILAHGAGAGMQHPFMTNLADELVLSGLSTIRFNFPYIDFGRKSPGSPKLNISAWKAVVDYAKLNFKNIPVFISGKSYGGRMASHFLVENSPELIRGIVYFGFPLHAPGKDSKDRAAHLTHIQIPQLFLQGTKDVLARDELILSVSQILKKSQIKMIEGADHSFKVKGKKHQDIIKELSHYTSMWVDSLIG